MFFTTFEVFLGIFGRFCLVLAVRGQSYLFLVLYCPRKQNLVRFTAIQRGDITARPRIPDCACNEGHIHNSQHKEEEFHQRVTY